MGLEYFASRDGIIKLGRFFCELIAWASIVSISAFKHSSPVQYAVAILIISWLLDIIWILLHASGRAHQINANMAKLNFWLALFMILMVFVGFICITVKATVPAWKNGTAWSFFTVVFWAVDAWFAHQQE